MKANQAQYPVATMCRLLEVSPSGYYAWRRRPASERSRTDAVLKDRIRWIHLRSRGTYGVPRIYAELRDEGVRVGRRRVARLMRAAGLQGVARRTHRRTTIRQPGAQPAPDLVQRDFAAAGPNRLWVADITYISTWTGFLHLAVVLDAWSRRVVGWAMALECELLDRQSFRSLDHARRAVFDFIEGWYNIHRRHSALGQISPARYELAHAYTT